MRVENMMVAEDLIKMNGVSSAHNGNGVVNGNGNGTHSNGLLSPRQRIERKMSTPLAPPFMVSAPGKVIVFGEHSVVHGKVRSLSRVWTSPERGLT